ncbi:MAG: hypothetical protein ACRYG2_37975 [Janthinobacterium lividum]
MDLHLPTVYRSALLGATTGARSFSGIAAQVAVTPSLARRQPERALGHLRAKALLGLAALGEIVGDKLPTTPSRLSPPALVGRLGLAAVTALLVARADDEAGGAVPASVLVAVPVAVGASLASAFLGSAWRGRASKALGRDWPGAVLEDVAAVTLAVVATRL